MLLRLIVFFGCWVHPLVNAANDQVNALYLDWQNSPVFHQNNLQKNQLNAFVKQAQQLCLEQPDNPQACALSGMIQGFYSGLQHNLQGLKLAKQARDDLQHALALNPRVYGGEAYAALGTLYHVTPGWPFSFGSQPMAERLLRKAQEVDPQGVMSNLRLGEYLYDEEQFDEAKQYLQLAVVLGQQHEQPNWLDFQLLHARQLLARAPK